MKKIYAPWRNNYTTKTAHKSTEDATEKECIFCEQFEQKNDADHLILRRFKYHVVMMNRYPYNAGHLLILPLKHKASLSDLTSAARAELMELTHHCTEILKKALDAHGINIGMNLGKAAGAGLPTHLHMHVLPRWRGDTNFLPLLAEVKPVSVDLKQLFKRLKPHIEKINAP